jgi:hypothetical protein
MSKIGFNTPFKRLQNRYKLIVMNEDSFEEVTSFRLSRRSVYIAISTIFILLIGITTGLLWFTPLKQFTPGYRQGYAVDAKYRKLKVASDSILYIAQMQTTYIEHIKTLLSNASVTIPLDTSVLPLEKLIAEKEVKNEKNEK